MKESNKYLGNFFRRKPLISSQTNFSPTKNKRGSVGKNLASFVFVTAKVPP